MRGTAANDSLEVSSIQATQPAFHSLNRRQHTPPNTNLSSFCSQSERAENQTERSFGAFSIASTCLGEEVDQWVERGLHTIGFEEGLECGNDRTKCGCQVALPQPKEVWHLHTTSRERASVGEIGCRSYCGNFTFQRQFHESDRLRRSQRVKRGDDSNFVTFFPFVWFEKSSEDTQVAADKLRRVRRVDQRRLAVATSN
ncbi:hypothetical protein BLNAU_25166 [Blattamonas nauphoetae]|uniref:Uncharacterized protein n=1 Tax=Blattamonas nauphoetae TaxID=2049346 RepID=A0ABQ9WKB5_9EUKA|nr:hypothetical protein BLNAU_25166 [Blattamonas nauphoetae]